MSQRSRRSARYQRYVSHDPTDDEDSDDELEAAEDMHRPRSRREMLANRTARRGGRKMSTQSNFEMDTRPIESDTGIATTGSSSRNRFTHKRSDAKRGGSVARSLHEYPVTETMTPDHEIPFNRLKKDNVIKGRKSDSLTSTSDLDSEKNSSNMTSEKQENQIILKTRESPVKLESTSIKSVSPKPQTPKQSESQNEKPLIAKQQSSLIKWECEHCTFVNEPDARICAICCKTSTKVLETLPPSPPELVEQLDPINDEKPQTSSTSQRNSSSLNVNEGRKDRKITFWTGSKTPSKLVK